MHALRPSQRQRHARSRRDRPAAVRPYSRGLTLVELLAVITILSVLAALLLPALRRAMQSAHKIACSAHLRQQGLFMNLYANDFDGRIWSNALAILYTTQGAEDYAGGWLKFWYDLDPAVGEDRFVWRCPSVSGDKDAYWHTKADFPVGNAGYKGRYNYGTPVCHPDNYGISWWENDTGWGSPPMQRPLCSMWTAITRASYASTTRMSIPECRISGP